MTERALPECDSECGELLRRQFGEEGIDAHVTHVPPLFQSPYENLNMRCPHGVLWYTTPTSEQIVKFLEDGAP